MILRVEHLPQLSQPHRLPDDHILDGLELLLPGQGHALRQVVFVGAQYLLPHLIPQFVGMGDTGISGQLVHDLIHHRFQRCLQIAVLFFAAGEPQAIRQMGHQLLDERVVRRPLLHAEDQLPHHRLGVLVERVPPLGLLPVELRQILPEDLSRQIRLDLGDTIFRQVAGLAVRAVADHVDMGVVGLIVEGGVPPELIPGNLHGLGHLHGAAGEQAFPPLRVIVSQTGGVLPPQGKDRQPHAAGMVGDLLRHLGECQGLIRSGEQGVGPPALGAGPAGDVADVVLFFRRCVVVVLQRPADELRGVAPGGRGGVVLVLEGPPAEGEIPEELLHHLPLFFRSWQLGSLLREPLGALPGGHVPDVVAQVGGGFFRAALDVGTLEDQAWHGASSPTGFPGRPSDSQRRPRRRSCRGSPLPPGHTGGGVLGDPRL